MGPYTSYLKVNIVLNNVIGEQSFNFDDFDWDIKVRRNLFYEVGTHFFREDSSKANYSMKAQLTYLFFELVASPMYNLSQMPEALVMMSR